MELNELLDSIASEAIESVKEWQRASALFEARIAKIQQLNAETIGKVEADKLRDRLENRILRGRKLFTKEQLAEVAQAFTDTVEKMVAPDARRTSELRWYPSITSEPVPPSHKNIIEAIRTLQHAAWENSKAHGWNEAVDNPASALMMITREVSELAEEERDASSGESTKIPGFSKKEEEAADIAIRLLSYCGARNMRLGAAICAKHEFNKTRPYRHGDKLF